MKNNSSVILILSILIIVYAGLSFFSGSIIDEDAFIYFRCAENIVQGYGFVFNPGGERIEACSSVTWLLLLALFRWLGFNIIISAKILGIILGALSLVLIYRITKNLISDMSWALAPSLLTALSIPFVMWNQMGLETSLYTAVLLLLVLTCMTNKLFFWLWPAVALMLIATRPEGFFLLLGLLPALYFFRERKKSLNIRLYFFYARLSACWLCASSISMIFSPARFITKYSRANIRWG